MSEENVSEGLAIIGNGDRELLMSYMDHVDPISRNSFSSYSSLLTWNVPLSLSPDVAVTIECNSPTQSALLAEARDENVKLHARIAELEAQLNSLAHEGTDGWNRIVPDEG